MDETTIRELKYHVFRGTPPDVPTYEHIDTDALTAGDTDPMYVTLPIAEIGKVSRNNLLYDEPLVDAIEAQLQEGATGIRGHIREGDESSAFPLNDVYWVGHVRVNETTWAKGYIPPGATRDDVRRLKIVRGKLGTSIYGKAIRETVDASKGVWRAKNFDLQSLDLAPFKRASLPIAGDFQVTSEMDNQGEPKMPDKAEIIAELTAADIPATLREQIIKESQVQARVAELETKAQQLETQVAELATFKQIVAEIRATIGNDVDMVPVITEYHNMVSKLAEMMGVPYSNICIKVEEMHEQVAQMSAAAFTAAVDAQVEELTQWDVKAGTDAAKRVNAFRSNFKKALLGAVNGDKTKIAETAQSLWADEYQFIAESVVQSIAGPAAVVNGSNTPNVNKPSEQQIAEARGRVGF